MPRKRSFKRVKNRLEARRSELIDALSAGLAESKSTDVYRTMDAPEAASTATSTEMVFHFVEMESDELDEIEEALERIDEGTYGVCECCGHNITNARLTAMPTAKLCIECKQAVEAGELDPHVSASEDWERVADFERRDSGDMALAMARGEKIT